MNKLIAVFVFLYLANSADTSDANTFFANKVKTIINLIFEQTTYGIVNIPFFQDITLQKLRVNDLVYTNPNNHHLKANFTVKALVLGSEISNTFIVGMEFKVQNDQTIPISYEFEISNNKKDMMMSLMSAQVNKMLKKLIGKALPYNIFPSYISLENKTEEENYKIGFDVSQYMTQRKHLIEQVEKNAKKEQQRRLQETQL